ncbi:MAG: hypothetical protein JXJ04_05910 [Spirochaetales bacterium]|nr:hypothetical protein [Spirochaetales bacterium]
MRQRSNLSIYILIILFTLMHYTAYSEDTEVDEETLKLLKNVLQMELEVNLIQPGQNNVWNAKKVKYTIPGYSVLLKVEGTNIKFHGYFTPYLRNDRLLLITQSQVWLTDPVKHNIRYFTCIKSISMEFGEKVVYLPFGITKNKNENEAHNIEIDILIIPYKQETNEVNLESKEQKQEQKDPEK